MYNYRPFSKETHYTYAKLICTITFIFYSSSFFAQTDKVVSLINRLDNDQLYGTCNYAWVLKMNSSPGDSLIKMGKNITPQLIPLLEDKDKGVIVHYILSNIWNSTWQFSSSFDHYDQDSTLDYTYCNLKFYDKNGHIFANDSVLSKNKKKWIEKVGRK